ncbi:MAG: hypothetical protein P4L34_13380 [Paludibacter sp.]|nr:hypothetical protein [Paludibacter sp.]
MKFQLTILATMLSLSVFSQIKPVNFNDCTVDKMFVQAETNPTWKCDSVTMIDYMNKHVIDKELATIIQGRVIVGIMIYENGKTCCHDFFNLTKSDLNPLAFKEAVNNMPNWAPALQSGKPITFLKPQVFYIKNGKFTTN